jgi:Ca2+-binding RTX toxin-like protein
VAQNAYEQYMLELVNRARLDPTAEAALYGVNLGTISATSKQPLAANDLLLAAAENHSQWMLDTDTFSHTGAGGSDPGDRMAAAGYNFTGSWTWGENIAWQGTTGALDLVATIDAEHAALFRSDGHRANILNDTFQEIGVGIRTGTYGSYNAAMVTQDFARSGSGAFLTGVAYTDTDSDDFYSVGEGRGGVQIAAQLVGGATTTVTTDAPGGYDSKLAAGIYNVTMSGGGLPVALGLTITMANRNIKLDLLGTTAVACSGSLIMGANLAGLTLLGTENLSGTGNALANVIAGNKGANTIDGGDGADTLTGGAGNDTFILKAGQADGDVIGDFTGNGSAAGDSMKFDGYSSAAVLTNVSGNTWQIVDGSKTETFTINGALNAADYSFVNVGSPPAAVAPPPEVAPTGGTPSDLTVTGTASADNLVGGAGNDMVNGEGGADRMTGGLGDDTYIVDNANDIVIEAGKGGTDTVSSSVNYTLGANLENLLLTGAAALGTGNALDNVMTGNDVGDKLSGVGGDDTITGGAGNDTIDGGIGNDSLVGGAGNDTYGMSSTLDVVHESSGGGSDTVQAAFSIDLTTPAFAYVENVALLGTAALFATGTDADGNGLVGNAGANTLAGGGGNDTLNGGIGADNLVGGAGSDLSIVDNAKDVVDESAGGGTDTVRSSISFSLLENGTTVKGTFENLTLIGTRAINGTGNDLANLIIGNAGANKLIGNGGGDTMQGGGGNDTYGVDNPGDVVNEVGGSGIDTVQSSVTFNLTANGTTVLGDIEKLTLLAGAGGISATGNALANTLIGNEGNNTLDGQGGADRMTAGLGDDTYVADNAKDIVTEAANGGTDTAISSVNYALGANLENLVLIGAAILGTGNALNNVMTGNDLGDKLNGLGGNDTITGGAGNDTIDGGIGNDSLVGSAGNDTYILSSALDVVHESSGAGNDTARVSFNVDLTTAAFANVENATLLGTAALFATGTDADNVLVGNTGANTLAGGGGNDTLNGGAGADSLVGGAGHDLFIVDNAKDVVDESSGGGTDTVQSSISFSLPENGMTVKGTFENLTLTGTGAINGIGNDLANLIIGNAGANKLIGNGGNDTLDGGSGNDTLTGGLGSDAFVRHALSTEGKDTITDFQTGPSGDKLDIHDLLAGFVGGSDPNDFVHLVESGGNTTVQVDADGAVGGGAFADMVILTGVTGLSVNQLVADGNLELA